MTNKAKPGVDAEAFYLGFRPDGDFVQEIYHIGACKWVQPSWYKCPDRKFAKKAYLLDPDPNAKREPCEHCVDLMPKEKEPKPYGGPPMEVTKRVRPGDKFFAIPKGSYHSYKYCQSLKQEIANQLNDGTSVTDISDNDVDNYRYLWGFKAEKQARHQDHINRSSMDAIRIVCDSVTHKEKGQRKGEETCFGHQKKKKE